MNRRRNTSAYQVVHQDGVELLVSHDLARYAQHLSIDLRQFLIFRHLKATAQLSNGLVSGRHTA